jgi:hypothetical protein
MENNDCEKITHPDIRNMELRIKRYQLWTAIAVFAAALIPTVTTLTRINDVLRDIGKLERKPLEGEWFYRSRYEKYYDETNARDLQGGGKALIIWKNLYKRYEINISYGIKRDQKPDEPLLASFLHGYLEADLNGWPESKSFTIDNLEIVNRVHYKGAKAIEPFSYQFKDCKLNRKSTVDDRIQTIECIFETTISKSYLTLTFDKPLH